MTDATTLTDKLRTHAQTWDDQGLMAKAADLIEQRDARIAELEAQLAAPNVSTAEQIRDAERYRVVRQAAYLFGISNPRPEELDAKVDKARALLHTTEQA